MKMPNIAILEEIKKCGAIPFARFMELALYCPETGYYEKNQDSVGRRGDFITSVSTGSLFGELLAFQFGQWLQELRIANCESRIVEAGAHDGKLAADILNWLKNFRPELFSGIEYWILEPSFVRQQWQRETLKEFQNIRWHSSLAELPSPLSGVFFSNELLDAFPVRRLGWNSDAKKWFEWGVALDGEHFIWTKIAIPEMELPPSVLQLAPSLLEVLPDGYITEVSPAAENWWRGAARILGRGKVLAIDYGYTSENQFSPARTHGTLRAYHLHRVSHDLLANPGEQDLTAHVNFSAIQDAGEAAGLGTELFCPQPQFLTRILGRAVKEKSFAAMDAKQVRQFQTLTHPEHLGRAFHVLVQGK
jgi:SAM-dependent MidA family methyltransferase